MRPDPAFLDGRAGALFTIARRATQRPDAPPVLILPPFAEEMNRTRRFLGRLAETLTRAGSTTMLLDPFGTGDSAGDFAEAGWDLWRDDTRRAMACLAADAGRPPWLLGLRTGALLAADTLAGGSTDCAGLICVQPVTDGGKFLQQFLRARTMAAMARGERETTTEMLAALRAGETLNVAGYPLSPALALALAQARLADLAPPDGPVLWYEIGRAAGDAPARRLTPPDSWSAAIRADRHVAAEPFWMIEEPVIPERLIAAIDDDLAAAVHA